MLIGACLHSQIQAVVGLLLEAEAVQAVVAEPAILTIALCQEVNSQAALSVASTWPFADPFWGRIIRPSDPGRRLGVSVVEGRSKIKSRINIFS